MPISSLALESESLRLVSTQHPLSATYRKKCGGRQTAVLGSASVAGSSGATLTDQPRWLCLTGGRKTQLGRSEGGLVGTAGTGGSTHGVVGRRDAGAGVGGSGRLRMADDGWLGVGGAMGSDLHDSWREARARLCPLISLAACPSHVAGLPACTHTHE